MGVTVGDCAAQSIVEALAVLVGIRVWGHLMKGRRLHLKTRTDNAAALALQGKLASSTPALNFFGAELAIELEVLGVEEVRPSNLPGSLNTVADALSRLRAPGSAGKSLPVELAHGERRAVPERGAEWYRLPAPRRRPDLWGSSSVAAGQQAGQQAWQAARASEYAQLGDGPSF